MKELKTLIIIPAYNEENSIKNVVDNKWYNGYTNKSCFRLKVILIYELWKLNNKTLMNIVSH